MSREFAPNGEMKFAVRPSFLDGKPWKERIEPARITPQTVRSRLERFDRATGRDLSAGIRGYPRRLLAYRLAGFDWVTLYRLDERGQPTAAMVYP